MQSIHLILVILLIYIHINCINNREEAFTARVELYMNSIRLICSINDEYRYLSVNIESPYNYITQMHFPDLDSKDPFDLKFPKQNITIKADSISMPFKLNELDYCKIDKLNLYKTEDNNLLSAVYSSSLAFAYDIPDKSHSITHWLKSLGIITNLQFTIRYESKRFGLLYMGSIPNQLSINTTQSSVPIAKGRNRHKAHWSFNLDYIFIDKVSYLNDNTYYTNAHPAHFASMTHLILVPKDAYAFILNYYFNEILFRENKCRRQLYGRREVSCNREIIGSLKDIIFVINGSGFKFRPEDLFEEHGNEPEFNILMNDEDEDKNEWVFGNLFYSKYITTFDYDNKEIRFHSYHHSAIEKVELNTLFPMRRILIWIGVGLGVIVLLILVCYFKSFMRRRKIKKIFKPINLSYNSL